MSQSAGRKAAVVSAELGWEIGNRKAFLALAAVLAIALYTSSCSSVLGAGQNQTPSPSPAIAVNISPANPRIDPGATLQFTATVTGTSNVGVVWSATGGSITNDGLFTSSKTATSASVSAASVANPQSSASTKVTLAAPAPLAIVSNSLPAASAGTVYSTILASTGGTPSYSWVVSSGSLPPGLSLSSSGKISGTPNQAGSFSFTVKVTDSGSQSTATSLSLQVKQGSGSKSSYTGFDGPAELPRSYMKTAIADTPAPGSLIAVNAGGDLQSALDRVHCGDTIQLQAGAVFQGNFKLPAVSCDDQHWIIIRTSTPDSSLPPEGTRITPCYAGVSSLPGRPSYSCSNPRKLMATIQLNQAGMINGPIQFVAGANHYRFIGLEITRAVGVGGTVNLIAMQDTTLGSADHIIVDRCWVHGTAQDETRRGIALGSMSQVGIVDSYFTDFHCTALVGTCVDSNAIGGGSGDYPQTVWSIVNNFLEAAGENILLGGAGATITPSDLEIRHNHFFKPLIWLKGTRGFVGGKAGNPFVVKNHFEAKNGQRILLEGNIFENSWGGFSQNGHSIVLTPRNNYDGAEKVNNCGTCRVADVTIRYSTISHVGATFNLSNPLTNGVGASLSGRYSIHDITIDDVEATALNGGGGLFLIMSNWPDTALTDIQISHITAFPDPDGRILALGNPVGGPQMTGFVFTDNVVTVPSLPIFGAAFGDQNCDTVSSPIQGLKGCFPGYVFTGNLLIASPAKYSSEWPAGNTFPASVTSMGFVNYNNAIGGNYALSASSPYKAKQGSDPGADVSAINTAIAGVR